MVESVDRSYRWKGEELDLDGYLAGIGFTGERAPTVATLRELVYRHTTTLPFENLEALFGRPVPLGPAEVQEKMIRRGRGGYCYENVGLFAAALERLGFGVTGLSARVTLGAVAARPATHALVRVTTAEDDRVWICDVGFGQGPPEPWELVPRAEEFALGQWRFRFERRIGELGADLWALHQFGKDGWVERYTFTTNPQYRIDFEVGNHFVSTSPRSPFTMRPFVQRFLPDVRHILDGHSLSAERPDGTVESRELETDEIPGVLKDIFGIDLTDADAHALTTGEWVEQFDRPHPPTRTAAG
ncbi:arylamine N-acetyltransferase family protein [Nocardia higoensis]|uniref:arylamine N-acetyltransferase family protein n=1 Tax=Nocardia higoensis TaxID=228599 RepID=UPI0006850812|nr:arylamine N-acetyltransferase [Nocardia higoensis]